MDRTKIIKIYEILIKGFKLTKEILNIYNYKDEDIKELVKENIIKEINSDEWTIKDVNGLYKYGIYLKLNKQQNKAEACFRQCYKLEPTNRKVCLELMLFELKRKNYIAVKRMFSILEQIEPDKYKEDNNLYLFLLSVFLFNDQEYKERVERLNIKDILIPYTKEYEYKSIHNKIRCSLLNQKYLYAISLINDLKRLDIAYNVELELLKELTANANNLNNQFKLKMKKALFFKNYNRILELLEGKSKNNTLTNMEENILFVTKAIIGIINTNKIPTIIINETDYLHEAINNNNFILAKQLNEMFLKKNNKSKEEDILNILLNDIIALIEKITNEKQLEQISHAKEEQNELTIENIEDNILSSDEELAYYIKDNNLPFKDTVKKLGILPEQVIIIKLIYARDYFYEGNYEEGNQIMKEIEESKVTGNKVLKLLTDIKCILPKENLIKIRIKETI